MQSKLLDFSNISCSGGHSCEYRFVVNQNALVGSVLDAKPYGGHFPKTYSSENPDGLYYIHLQAKNQTGGESTPVSIAFLLDNTAPTVAQLTPLLAPGIDRYLLLGESIDIQVSFNEPVSVDTALSVLELTVGGETGVQASYKSSQDDVYTYTYTVASGHSDGDGIIQATGVSAVTDTAGNQLVGNCGYLEDLVVDAVAPTVTGLEIPGNAAYSTGQELAFIATFDEPVILQGRALPRSISPTGAVARPMPCWQQTTITTPAPCALSILWQWVLRTVMALLWPRKISSSPVV